MKKKLGFIVLFLIFSFSLLAQSVLVSSVLITRHGDRAPFGNIKNFNYNWGSPLEELTPIGMNQEYNLGKRLRSELVYGEKLLPTSYVPNSLKVVSSASNRTFDSAQSLLIGLYPMGTGPNLPNGKPALPNNFQPIPITILPSTDYSILTQYPDYLKLLNQYVYNTKGWQDKQNQYAPKFKQWTKILGNPINSLADVLGVGDMLIVAKSHGLPMPTGLSNQDVNDIINLTSWGLAYQFKNLNVSHAMGDTLLKEIIGNFSDVISGKDQTKLFYYSGHDITILPIMAILGAPLNETPGYAANVLFKLYKTDKNQYFVTVEYNQKVVKLPLMNGKSYCSFSNFSKLESQK